MQSIHTHTHTCPYSQASTYPRSLLELLVDIIGASLIYLLVTNPLSNIQAAVKGLLTLIGSPAGAPQNLEVCRLLNETICGPSITNSRDGSPFTIVVYNPLSMARDSIPIRIPVIVASSSKGSGRGRGGGGFRVTALESNAGLFSSIVPATAIASSLQEMQHQKESAQWELLFQTSIPAFSAQAFTVQQVAADSKEDHLDMSSAAAAAPSRSKPLGDTQISRRYGHKSAKQHSSKHHVRTRAPTQQHAHTNNGHASGGLTEIENEFVTVAFDGVTGRMVWMRNKEDGITIEVDQNLHWYESAQAGDGVKLCGEGQQKSGAYIFRPNHTSPDGQSAKCVSGNCQAVIHVLKSPLVSEVQQVFSNWATQTVRLYTGAKSVEIEWTVGPVPVEDGVGKEIISRFNTNVTSNGYFLTDSNGRDMLSRRRCVTKEGTIDTTCRPSVPRYNVTEPIAGNFFPINTAISIKDETTSFGVAVDRAQAGASLLDGQIELMVHRRLLCDDNRGVAEPLNETQSISPYDWIDGKGETHHEPYRIGKGLVVRGKHYLFLSPPASAARAYRTLQDHIYYEPVTVVGDAFTPEPKHTRRAQVGDKEGGDEGRMGKGLCKSGAVNLPENVMILTVEKQPPTAPAKKSTPSKKFAGGPVVLLRVAHRFGVGEDSELSSPAVVALADLFCAAHVAVPTSVEELSLSGNQPVADMLGRKRKWRREKRVRIANM